MKKSASRIKSALSLHNLFLFLFAFTIIGVLPFFDQFITSSKLFPLTLTALGTGLLYFILALKNKKTTLTITPFTIPTLGLGAITLISIFANNKYPIDSLLNLGGALVSCSIIIVLAGSLIKKNKKTTQKFLKVAAATAVLLILTTLLQNFGVGPSLLINKFIGIKVPNNLGFNLSGSLFIAFQFLIIVVVGLLSQIISSHSKTKKQITTKASALIVTIGTVLGGWFLLPGKATSPIILSPTASWNIFLNTIKDLKILLIGVGPDNYDNAFNLFRPEWLNNQAHSDIQFIQASNIPLTFIVTLGLLGLGLWLTLFITTIVQTRKISIHTQPLHNMLLTTFLLQIVFPINIVLIIVQTILIVMWIASEKERFTIKVQIGFGTKDKKSIFINTLITSLFILGWSVLFYLFGRAYYAKFLMFKSSLATIRQDYTLTYELQKQAVSLNPFSEKNRTTYGVTNITLAAIISQKAELTDQEKQEFATLVQQAIKEGKAAIMINPQSANTWINMAQIYQSLIGIAQDADQWTVTSYVEAIKLAPTYPGLRLQLGNIFYNRGEYETALNFFNQSIALKADFVSGYYNAANTFSRLEKWEEAKVAYQKTLHFLPENSAEHTQVSKEIELLEKITVGETEKETLKLETQEKIQEISPIETTPEKLQVEAPPLITE